MSDPTTTAVRATHANVPGVADEDAVALVSFPCPNEPIVPAAVGAVRAKVVRAPDQPPLLALGWVRPPPPGSDWARGAVGTAAWDPGAYPDARRQWRCATLQPGLAADCVQPPLLDHVVNDDGSPATLWLAPPPGSGPDAWDALRVDGGAWCVDGGNARDRCAAFAPVPGVGLTGWNLSVGASPPLVWRPDGECDGIAPCTADLPTGYCQTTAP